MFSCTESGCEEKFDDQNEFYVHSSYHNYHQKIKDQGKEEVEILEKKFNVKIKCPLIDRLEGCYYFPQLPLRLICEWYECKTEFLSAEQFYNHVTHHAHRHCDRCYWAGCNKTFKRMTLQIMRDHLRVHTLQKLFACPYCGNFFTNKIKFDDHFLRHLPLPEFLQNDSLEPSVTSHTDGETRFLIEEYNFSGNKVKIYRCILENCDKRFMTSSLLREHIRVHSIKNRCDQCSYVAISASRLMSHKLYRHQEERNFECTICSKTFKQRGDLRAHVKRHQIVEPYRCDKCDFETLNEEGLNTHAKLHDKKHDYFCHLCHRVFSRGNNLSRHLKDQHKFELPEGQSRFKYKLVDERMYLLDTVNELVLSPSAATNSLEQTENF